MNVTKNGIIITIPDAEIIRMALERFELPRFEPLRPIAPRIGEAWEGEGGVYAGIARGRDGAPDYHLIVGPEYDGKADWDAMTKWAAADVSVDGIKDYTLPFRKEQALAFANVPELFKPESYWSCEQHASGSGCAWRQGFSNGGQDHWSKDGGLLRGRAFRRLVIQ